LVSIEQLGGVYVNPDAQVASKVKKLKLAAKIESINSLGATVISFSNLIDIKKTDLRSFDSSTMQICVKARNNISPFGDLCGTWHSEAPKKRELDAIEKRCLKTQEFCGVEYT
jgi:hypothetical protein